MSIDILFDKQFLYMLVSCTCVGGIAGYIGSLMVTKRMALMGGALGHLTLPGIALAIYYGFDVSIGALVILLCGIAVIWAIEKRTKLPTESVTAIVFATSLAIAFLFLKHEEMHVALIGDISHITFLIAATTVVTSVFIYFVIRHIVSAMVISSISEDLALVEGIPVSLYKLIYLACIAVVVAMGVRIVGGLMTAALVAIPAATSKNMSNNLYQYISFSIAIGAISCAVGVSVSYVSGLDAGPMIILSSSLCFLLSLMFKR